MTEIFYKNFFKVLGIALMLSTAGHILLVGGFVERNIISVERQGLTVDPSTIVRHNIWLLAAMVGAVLGLIFGPMLYVNSDDWASAICGKRGAKYLQHLKNDMDYSQYPNLTKLCKELRERLSQYRSLQEGFKGVINVKAGKSRFFISDIVGKGRQVMVACQGECVVVLRGHRIHYANDDLLFQLPIVLDYLKGEVERLEGIHDHEIEVAQMQKEMEENNMRMRKENLAAIDEMLV